MDVAAQEETRDHVAKQSRHRADVRDVISSVRSTVACTEGAARSALSDASRRCEVAGRVQS